MRLSSGSRICSAPPRRSFSRRACAAKKPAKRSGGGKIRSIFPCAATTLFPGEDLTLGPLRQRRLLSVRYGETAGARRRQRGLRAGLCGGSGLRFSRLEARLAIGVLRGAQVEHRHRATTSRFYTARATRRFRRAELSAVSDSRGRLAGAVSPACGGSDAAAAIAGDEGETPALDALRACSDDRREAGRGDGRFTRDPRFSRWDRETSRCFPAAAAGGRKTVVIASPYLAVPALAWRRGAHLQSDEDGAARIATRCWSLLR